MNMLNVDINIPNIGHYEIMYVFFKTCSIKKNYKTGALSFDFNMFYTFINKQILM